MSTFRVSQYAPANETEFTLVLERANLNGAMISAIAYGAHFVYFVFCLQAMHKLRKKDPKYAYWMIAYVTTLFLCGSIVNTANTVFNQFMFVDNRDFPGGPLGYLAAKDDAWYIVFAYSAWVLSTWLQDALLIYRLFIIWGGQWIVAVVPCMMFVSSIVTSIMWVVVISRAGSNRWQHLSVKIGLAWGSTTVGTTVLVTLLIVARLWYIRRQVKKHAGKLEGNPYLSVSAMFVESASLYSIWGGAFFIFYARQSGLQSYFLGAFGQVTCIAPMLILLRVASGAGWSRTTAIQTTWPTAAGTTQRASTTASPVQSDIDLEKEKSADVERTLAFAEASPTGTRPEVAGY